MKEEHLDALITAMLSANAYGLQKAHDACIGMREAGLCEPSAIIGKDVETVGNLMKAAGFNRGGTTYIIAPRFISLMKALSDNELGSVADLYEQGKREEFIGFVSSLSGFGPRTAELAWELMSPSVGSSGRTT